jgi:hypothetical protein
MSDIYDRQTMLMLRKDRDITIVGCGGIGYWVAKFAAMSGIPKMYLFDPDIFEIHNLNRIDIPVEMIGKNKAAVTRQMVISLRPEMSVYAYPFKLQEHTFPKTPWLVDCTDLTQSQLDNQAIAKTFGSIYLKAGYNGEDMSIHNAVAEWGEAVDGYTVVPSWVVPASIVAALTVAKIMKYHTAEMSGDVEALLKQHKRGIRGI